MLVFVIVLSLINIVLWLLFLIRFKKLFSTDKIIESTSKKMNKLVNDIDKTTKRDLFLSSESTKRMQAMLDEADAKMELFKEATQRLREMIAEADRISRKLPANNSIYNNVTEVPFTADNNSNQKAKLTRKNLDSYLQNSSSVKKNTINPDNSYEVVSSQQGDLFNQDYEASPLHDSPMQVTQDGAAFKEVPLIITKVYDESPKKNTEKSKKNLSKQVQELYNNGKTVEEIANELSCSRTEVQLVIDMNF